MPLIHIAHLTLNVTVGNDEQLKQVLQTVIDNKQKLHKMSQTLDQVLQSVQDESTQEDSLIALVAGIEQQLKDVLSGATLPPSVQAKVDAIFQAVETNKAKVAAAVIANTQSTDGGAGSTGTGDGSGTVGDGTGSNPPATGG
jgi:hypothetical protein